MRVLCLGNNTELTDLQTKTLAEQQCLPCHGLLSDLQTPVVDTNYANVGYYHSSVYDISVGRLTELAPKFDKLIILGQTREQYSHPDAFYKTITLATKLKSVMLVEFLDQSQSHDIIFFENLVNTNPSFCIFPFIELLADNGHTTVCCRSHHPVTKLLNLKDFSTNPEYQKIRQSMIQGQKLPDHCGLCYRLEDIGIRSARQQETVEWANRLGLKSLDDLNNITQPVYFEVRASNTCNLQCRMCGPDSSHLLAQEFFQIKLIDQISTPEFANFDIVNLDTVQKLYVAGGEPTAMPEFYDFLDRCIENNREFEFTINTNATKINNRFRQQLQQLPHIQFIISLDGYDKLNHYIRWPSNWNTIIDNAHYLKDQGHVISFNTTVSIYNISTLYQLLGFLDNEFPDTLLHCQLVESPRDRLSALNFPDAELVLKNLSNITQLNCYQNDALLASFIDGLIHHYQKLNLNSKQLKDFFEFNDLLDTSRNLFLGDYIPELEKWRRS